VMLSTRFDNAFVYAHQLHANQTRKGTTIPYLAHLISVAAIVLENGGDEDEAIAGLLHDAVEDQGGSETAAEISRLFDERVSAIVVGCSDSDTTPKPPWRGRKENYIAHIAEASPSIRLVSAADKLHNARAITEDFQRLGDRVWERFSAGPSDILWYYRGLADALQAVDPRPLMDELNRSVIELEKSVSRTR
jgi:(p)ppGpp synthase/HD superfamily hydrolase